ncbi:hypothetical protein SEUCBS139899_005919 [Sporothrix eucalyptigena]|uniref:Major facilitator superfamily (MFS) profile domain-containing protein n=1 Tax=Sporothrix eucalyptigena TaxID=1812306 RepID=A0ABP0AXB8_9PEZI
MSETTAAEKNTGTDNDQQTASEYNVTPTPDLERQEQVQEKPIDDDGLNGASPITKGWSTGVKIYYTTIPCFLAYLITFSASVTSSATAAFMVEFNVSRTVGILPSTIYMVGLAFGPMFIAPLSEFIGRRWLYTWSCACLIAFSAGAGASHTFAGVLVCRFLAGFFGTCGIAIGAGTIFDVWGYGQARGLAALLFTCGPFFGPSMGPMAGAYIMAEYGNNWRWTQWVICLVGAPIFVLILFMKETSPNRMPTTDDEGAKRPLPLLVLLTLKAAVVRSLTMLGTEAISFWLTLYTGYAYAVVFSFFASGNYVYTTDYGFDNRQVGLVFLAVVIGYVLAAILHIIIDKTLYARAVRLSPTGRAAPEHRLYSGMAGSIFLPIGLFWYAWASNPGGHWASLAASGIPFGLGAFVLFLSSIIYLVESYGAGAAASALAANGCIRYLLGAVFPLFTFQMYENLGIHWAGSLFAFLSLALLPIPWILFKYGHKLRARSRFAPAAV